GTTVVVITHRSNLIAAADGLMLLREGAVAALGPRDEVLAALAKQAQQAQQPQQAQPQPAAVPQPTPGA
ncbi:MAG: type I secretion system permease/ATPase, partial [Rubrivivax sp.]